MSGIKPGLQAEPLTQPEWNRLFHGDEWERHPTHSITMLEVARIRATIDNGGFAPEAPTDEEINHAIATAQGWKRGANNRPEFWLVAKSPVKSAWVEHVLVADYQPVTNLGQALEAAAALSRLGTGEGGVLRSGAPYIHEQVNRVVFQGATAADAARAIATHLYERIRNAGGEDETERARR